jgi:hypothetical protein
VSARAVGAGHPATIAQFEDLGVDEVMLCCHGRDLGQVDRLAAVL